MKKTTLPWLAMLSLVFHFGASSCASAQVIEERKGESNPSAVIFHSTMYGAGTGLLLGGAYALIEDDPDLSTSEILEWGLVGGVASGLLIGLIYVMARPEPRGDAEEVGMLPLGKGSPPMARSRIILVRERDRLGRNHARLHLDLIRKTF
jgi:drug/metabolite transporter (DMT)-like permease